MDSSVIGQVRCLGSIAFAVPLEKVKFRKFQAQDCIKWLEAGEEEDDEGGHVLKEARQLGLTHYQALAIVASQPRLHPEDSSKEPVVGMGVVFISPYIVGVCFQLPSWCFRAGPRIRSRSQTSACYLFTWILTVS